MRNKSFNGKSEKRTVTIRYVSYLISTLKWFYFKKYWKKILGERDKLKWLQGIIFTPITTSTMIKATPTSRVGGIWRFTTNLCILEVIVFMYFDWDLWSQPIVRVRCSGDWKYFACDLVRPLVIEKLVFATDWEACIFYKNYWEVWIGEYETTIDTLNWNLEKEKPIERLGKFGLINFPSNNQLSVWLVYDMSSPNYGVEVRWNENYLLCIVFWCLFGSFYCEVW